MNKLINFDIYRLYKKTVGIVSAILFSNAILSQESNLQVLKTTSLPNDSLTRSKLISSLNGFLKQKETPNRDNTFILKESILETSALVDEIKGIEKNNRLKDDNFYKAYLTNVTQLDSLNYLIQLSFTGISENTPIPRASFRFIARNDGNQFYFYSPLKRMTVAWKIKKIRKFTVYYKTVINISNFKKYLHKVEEFDKKLKANVITQYYSCDNFHEALEILGVDYKSDYNGLSFNKLLAHEQDNNLDINGIFTSQFSKFDPHDLWHERLRNVLSANSINRPVDEGCAYLYGGSWGISWTDILNKFKQFGKETKQDWFSLYNESRKFSEKNTPSLNVDFAINALIVRKIEKENGFASVIELLSCGAKEKGNENYFRALEKIAGISKSNFNEKIAELLESK